jgi:hypothetical protein
MDRDSANWGQEDLIPYVPQSPLEGQGDPTLVGQKRHDAAKAAAQQIVLATLPVLTRLSS